MCRNRAISMGIKTETIKGTQEDFVFEHIKYVNSTHSKSSLNNLDIYTLDPQHKPENCSYVVTLEDTGEKVIGYVEKDCFVCIDEDMLQKQEVSPRNIEQKLFSSAILNPYFSIVVADSPAGSGKTLIALSSAMKLVDSKTTNYNKIVYIRNSIESIDKGEDVGYLAGNDEKFKIYNYPLYDSLSFIAHKQLDRSNSNKTKANRTIITQEAIEEKTNELLKRYAIETMWVGEMRGRTISNAVVIVDEAQNMSAKTGSLVFSRLDEGCKLIVIGSNKQIDNPYINKYINTLSTLLLASKQNHPELNIFACELKKVLRGKITEFSERIFGSVKSK
jgi:PhoH-like ATPase